MKNEYTITIYETIDGEIGFDVYDGVLVNTGNEHEEVNEIDGGVCESDLANALDMVKDMVLRLDKNNK